ncbi:MAG: methylmalonyl-CoA mutase family protein, partial [Leptospira sp.]|nr:methylmalonyl-CoA mutase family protein [Leptospira sp.]
METKIYNPKNKIRFVTAASLYDGHDVSINIIRRMLQASGAEVIHLGHNRSVKEVVAAAIQEDVQGIAISSYQGGHIEYFRYLVDLLRENNASLVKVFGGGGGVIVKEEIEELEKYGVAKIFSPEDGMRLGLQGIINEMLALCDFPLNSETPDLNSLVPGDFRKISRAISYFENSKAENSVYLNGKSGKSVVVGITGTGGAGKSSLTDELIRRILVANPEKNIAVICIDPSKKKSGGALLGDRIRMNSVYNEKVYLRSLATRGQKGGIAEALSDTIQVVKHAGFDIILVETSGTGQSDSEIVAFCDFTVYVMTSDFGAPTQLEKIELLDYADIVAINKFDRKGSLDALRDVKKQFQRNHNLFTSSPEQMPVFGTIASNFNDTGVNIFYENLVNRIRDKTGYSLNSLIGETEKLATQNYRTIIPSERTNYLFEISTCIRDHWNRLEKYKSAAEKLHALKVILQSSENDPEIKKFLETEIAKADSGLNAEDIEWLENWNSLRDSYKEEFLVFKVRDKEIKQKLHFESLAGTRIPLVSLPSFSSYKELLNYKYKENLPGHFPFTAGVFPFRKSDEATTRMFAGEGTPERTNRRFHILSEAGSAVRLSTAFDSVTLYGEDPDLRQDNYGKIGNSGVSVPTLDDAKKLYSGFDLSASSSSVSMTINGPAPIILSFFFNAAIDADVEKYIRESGDLEKVKEQVRKYFEKAGVDQPVYYGKLPESHNGLGLLFLGVPSSEIIEPEQYEKIKTSTLKNIRGTVQADILKEDQAQNTCIFSAEFSLRMMGDVQEYFIQKSIRNFYSVSISGYHIAEAGANPITQLAFTLSNAFTYVEYYLSRGMKIDDFAANFS